MVNKAAVILLGGIVVVGVVVIGGVGALVLGVGGGGDAGTPTAVDGTPLPFTPTAAPTAADGSTPTVTESAPTAARTKTATVTGTATDVPRTTILPRRFDEGEIETLVARYVNDYREANGYDPLSIDGSTANRVQEMARSHSVGMANEGSVTHVVDGNTSTDRYYDHELYRGCQWESGLRNSIVRADNNGPESNENALETIGRTYAGQEYDDGKFNADESDVARAIVEAWWADDKFERRLTLPNAGSVGVGVEITQSGEVYVTANLCD